MYSSVFKRWQLSSLLPGLTPDSLSWLWGLSQAFSLSSFLLFLPRIQFSVSTTLPPCTFSAHIQCHFPLMSDPIRKLLWQHSPRDILLVGVFLTTCL